MRSGRLSSAVVYRVFGSEPWTAKDLLNRVEPGEFTVQHADYAIGSDELPGDIPERWERSRVSAAKSLGKWLGFRDGRWAGGLSVQRIAGNGSKHAKQWRVVDTGALDTN